MKLIIGTRGSALAMWQASHVANLLKGIDPGIDVELKIIKTQGDKILDAPLAKIGGKGLFTKEIEDALLEGSIDLAVHSMKDVPTETPEGLSLPAMLKREDPRDVFISRDGRAINELNVGEKIGTSSLRRRAFLLHKFPGLEVVSIRGNVDTRVKKIETENLAGALLAAAGIIRMGFSKRIKHFMSVDDMIPAIGQGAIGIETRTEDSKVVEIVSRLNDRETEKCVLVERAFLMRLGGGCQVPMAAYCEPLGDDVKLTGAVTHPDGSPIFVDTYIGPAGDHMIGVMMADRLIDRGADIVLKSVLSSDWKPVPVEKIAQAYSA
ncbi:MAG: hydroxymethylbilane synthase [Deltaproteobacteria bacterium]|nr:hydroxymethylbilane synthase [Deltaproteobacteria bacterium]